jgi:regulatory protein
LIITKIERQKKNRKRYNIYLEGGFYCGLYDDTILKYQLAAGDEITEDKINEIRDFDEYIFGKKTAFDYLSYRIRSADEIKKKLKAKKITENIISKVISHLEELKLLDDEQFALQLAREKIKNKGVSRKVLQQKFFQKGIPKAVGESVLDRIFKEVNEKELALRNFDKYYPKIKDKEKAEQKKKIFDYLARKGFDFDIIGEVIRENIH